MERELIRKELIGKETIPVRRSSGLPAAEWSARLCILFPFILMGRDLRTVVLSITAGLLFWCLSVSILQVRMRSGRSLAALSEGRCGRMAAVVACSAGFWYFLFHTAVFAKLWAELLRVNYAPQTMSAVLCVVPLAAGAVFPARGLRFRAGAGRALGAMLPVLAAVLAVSAADTVPAGAGEALQAGGAAAEAGRILTGGAYPLGSTEDILRRGFEIFACMGGAFLPFLYVFTGNAAAAKNAGAMLREGEAAAAAGMRKRRMSEKDSPAAAADAGKESMEETGLSADDTPAAAAGSDKVHMGHLLCLTGCICAATAGVFCAAASRRIPLEESWRLDFPAAEALKGLRSFGVDAGRLDTVFLLLVLAGLALTVAGGLWHVRRMYDYLCEAGARAAHECAAHRHAANQCAAHQNAAHRSKPDRSAPDRQAVNRYAGEPQGKFSGMFCAQRDRLYGRQTGQAPDALQLRRAGWRIVLLAVFLLAAGFRDAFSAIVFYRVYNVQLLVPLMTGFCLISLFFC